MFYHVKELHFKARVSEPDPRFATLLLDQFGGPNGELKDVMLSKLRTNEIKSKTPVEGVISWSQYDSKKERPVKAKS